MAAPFRYGIELNAMRELHLFAAFELQQLTPGSPPASKPNGCLAVSRSSVLRGKHLKLYGSRRDGIAASTRTPLFSGEPVK